MLSLTTSLWSAIQDAQVSMLTITQAPDTVLPRADPLCLLGMCTIPTSILSQDGPSRASREAS